MIIVHQVVPGVAPDQFDAVKPVAVLGCGAEGLEFRV